MDEKVWREARNPDNYRDGKVRKTEERLEFGEQGLEKAGKVKKSENEFYTLNIPNDLMTE